MIAPWKNEKIRRIYARPEIKASIEIILSVFTVAFLLFAAIRPTLAIVASLQKKVEDQEVVGRRLTTKISQLQAARNDLQTYASRLPDLSLATPDNHDQGGLAKRIEIIARENGLTINSLSADAVPLVGNQINLSDETGAAKEPERDGEVAAFLFSFDVSGNQSQILSFLSGIERMDRLVLLTSVNIKTEDFRPAGSETLVKGLRALGKGKAYYILKQDR